MPAKHDLIALQGAITVEVAQTTDAIREAQLIRHQVFYLERRLFDVIPSINFDQDRFDHAARHIIVRRTSDRKVIATSRVVPSQTAAKGGALPMHQYCCPTLFRSLPMEGVGEISRFAISKRARDAGMSGPVVRLALFQGILQISRAMRLTHWCALMEPSLIRLLSATGVQFKALGPLVEAYGQRQPCVAVISQAVSRGRMSHPHFYEAVAARTYCQAA